MFKRTATENKAENDEREIDVWNQKCLVAAWWLLLPQKYEQWDPLQNEHLTTTYNDR
jgi:hypothetical protein